MMRVRSILCASAALCLALSSFAEAAEPRVPPVLAAKRTGKRPPPPPATPSPQELLYVPIQPCRAFGASTPVPAGQTRNFQISGNGSFAGQGGPGGGCGIPASAKTVSMSISAQSASNGYLTAYAQGAPKPGTTALSYIANQTLTGGAIVPLGPTGQISIQVSQTTRLYGDITGYFAPQMWAYISSSGGVIDASSRITSAARSSIGTYTVTFDRSLDTCSGTASPDFTAHMSSVYTSGNIAYVYIYGTSGAPEDYWFNLHVNC
jgi:hypothetical protein